MIKVYDLIGRLLYQLARPAFRLFPVSHRVRCLIVADGEILLVKNWLRQRWWTLPGGGINRHEEPLQAAVRELQEEIGLTVPINRLRQLGRRYETIDGLACHLELVELQTDSKAISPNRLELVKWQWFPIEHLPEDKAPVVDEAVRCCTQTPDVNVLL